MSPHIFSKNRGYSRTGLSGVSPRHRFIICFENQLLRIINILSYQFSKITYELTKHNVFINVSVTKYYNCITKENVVCIYLMVIWGPLHSS